MRLKLTAPNDQREQLLDMVDSYDAVVEAVDQAGAMTSVVAQVGDKCGPCGSNWVSDGIGGK
jgi:hypothetical protein